MDREAQLKEERMDAVKEWMFSRNMPQALFVRVRKYYEHYYTRRAVFDEDEILNQLNPQLHTEVVNQILSHSIGRLPTSVCSCGLS